jgi:GNAT superfamily N-acetyltransferase
MTQDIRLFTSADSISELTLLIRRAYKGLADLGFNYTGAYQDESITLARIKDGQCYVLIQDSVLIGTITIRLHSAYYAEKLEWFRRKDVAMCGQFAVDPDQQRKGLGSKLMDFVEQRACELGALELALDTAEGALHLVRLYTRRGYRFIGFIQHHGKTYRSMVLSKTLR